MRDEDISSSHPGEQGGPPPWVLKALVPARWHDPGDAKLAGAVDERALLRRSCGASRTEPAPQRTALVRFRKGLVAPGDGESLFGTIAGQLRHQHVQMKHIQVKHIRVKRGTHR